MPGQRNDPLSYDEIRTPLAVDFHWALNVFPPLIGAADRIRLVIKSADVQLPDALREKILTECNFIINKSSQTLVDLNLQLKQVRGSKPLE